MIPPAERAVLNRQGYALFGNNSSAKLCHWTRKAIYGQGACYKQKFYGISCHRCIQMTPATDACTHNCVFCWRAGDFSKTGVSDPDEPADVVKGSIEAQRRLVSGFGGEARADKAMWEEARKPLHAAISLSGEPFCYPLLGGLVSEYRKAKITTFIVTNGTFPEALAALSPLPTQLYMSLVAPDEETYSRTCAPLVSGGFGKVRESLSVLKGLACRRVLRMTAVKGFNMHAPEKYARLVLEAEPDYVEVKSYMHRGSSTRRLAPENMPGHEETAAFARAIASEAGYSLCAEAPESRVALLARDAKAEKGREIHGI
jgi:tRNA wybutosine-synthesizing protein 1